VSGEEVHLLVISLLLKNMYDAFSWTKLITSFLITPLCRLISVTAQVTATIVRLTEIFHKVKGKYYN